MLKIVRRAPIPAALGTVALALALTTPASAAESAPSPSRVTVPLSVTIYDPCAGELVVLIGDLSFEGLVAVLENGQLTLQFKVQATDVVGSGLSSGLPYRLVGAAHGESTGSAGFDRAVTATDFAVIAMANPGATIGRAQAQPATTILLRVAISENGLVEKVRVEAAFVDQICT